MKVAAGQIQSIVQNPPAALRVILIFGPDAGLVRERAEIIARKTVADINDPFAVTVLSPATLSETSTALYDEMATPAFGGGMRLVRVPNATEALAAPLAKLVASLPDNGSRLIIEAGDLDKRSKLRSACETEAPAVCALPCYIEDSAQRQRIIMDMLQAEGLKIDRDLVRLLADALPPDRLALRSEIDKLALYARGEAEITAETIAAVIAQAGSAEVDELILLIASGQAGPAMQLYTHLIDEQTSPVAILRSAQRHFLRLQWARAHKDQGLSAREAVAKLQPKVFWKHTDKMAEQVTRWTSPRLDQALSRLAEAEAQVKRTGTPDTALVGQLLLALCR